MANDDNEQKEIEDGQEMDQLPDQDSPEGEAPEFEKSGQGQSSHDKDGIQPDVRAMKNQGLGVQAPRAGGQKKLRLFADDNDSDEQQQPEENDLEGTPMVKPVPGQQLFNFG